MPFSLFVLALYVFMQSVPAFGWFSVDPKATAYAGMLFVICVVLEAIFYNRLPNWFRHRA
jgi:hypothetical protein